MEFLGNHILSIDQFDKDDIVKVFSIAEKMIPYANREKKTRVLQGAILSNMFFEASTRTRISFGSAFNLLGGEVRETTGIEASSLAKGESLYDTARVLSGYSDLIVMRHPEKNSVQEFSEASRVPVINAGDGQHEHPTQALLDALTIRRAKGRLHRLNIAICGDIAHSRVARSNLLLLGKMENRIRLIGPPTLMPSQISEFGVEVYHDMLAGLKDVDVVMMLRIQKERMDGGFIPSEREYFQRYGLDFKKLSHAKDDAIVMHPGPMNRGVEIDGDIADDVTRSVIQEQVEMGVAVRMAIMDLLSKNYSNKQKKLLS